MEDDFKIPVLPGPQREVEENLIEGKKLQTECPYKAPVIKLYNSVNQIN